jgi:hypothetical protein
MEKILLHICCGVCASGCIKRLQSEGFEVTGFFYNPNIYPGEEYSRRLEAARTAASLLGIALIEGAYQPQEWQQLVQGMQEYPEGGQRCLVCYRIRLESAWKKARQEGIAFFASTLSVSPHKDTAAINRVGSRIDEKGFKPYDFKEAKGFDSCNLFSKEHGLYRQRYCGCQYSQRKLK